jgi:hypothetical protein
MVKFAGPGLDGSRGYTAEQGLEAILVGKNIDSMNRGEGAMTPKEMRTYIVGAPKEKNVSYSDEARRFAKALLIRADKDITGFLKSSYAVAEEVSKSEDYDLTGFMYGWALNAVRYIYAEYSILNPAIMTIER